MNWRNIAILAVIVVPLLVVLAMGFGTDPRAVPSVLPGKPAPECRLLTFDDEPRTLESFRGRPVVLNFWATWCVPCEAEHALLQDAARRYGSVAQFIGVVYQDTAENARRYLDQKGSSYANFMDDNSICAINYGVAGVPETFFIDADGVIRHKETGPVTAQLLAQAFAGDPAQGGAHP